MGIKTVHKSEFNITFSSLPNDYIKEGFPVSNFNKRLGFT